MLELTRYFLPALSVLFMITLAKVLLYVPKDAEKLKRGKDNTPPTAAFPLIFLICFELMTALQTIIFVNREYIFDTVICFGSLIAITLSLYVVSLIANKQENQPPAAELAALYLTTIGFCICASAEPSHQFKILTAAVLGVVVYVFLMILMKSSGFLVKMRFVMMGMAMLLLLLTIIFGEVRHGAQNWINLGFVTVQPSEFAKSLYIIACAGFFSTGSNVKKILTISVFTFVCMAMLVYMSDFGSALIFFVTLVIILILTSKSMLYVLALLGLAGAGGTGAVFVVPYVFKRFETWGKAFQFANTGGFQQSRTLIAILSGGLFGLGAGQGFLRKVVASDTDLVFGIVCEEWGIITGLAALSCILLLFLHTIRSVRFSSGSFYVIASIAAAGLFLFQTALNLFGSTDVLPLTGVTFAFVSNGGTSIIACWALLAIVKSARVHKRTDTT